MKVIFRANDGTDFESRRNCLQYERDCEARSRRKASGEALNIRWMVRRDMDRVLRIEQASHEFAWTEAEFLSAPKCRNAIGMVAEAKGDHEIRGFVVYQLWQESLAILNMAVCPQHRRRGVGSRIVGRLIDKLSQQRRNELFALVGESNLPAHLFFRAMGFRAGPVVHDAYEVSGEDGYPFTYRLPVSAEVADADS